MLLIEIICDPPPLGQVCHPPTQEEIARASKDAYWIFWTRRAVSFDAPAYVEFLLAYDALHFCACDCAFAEDVAGCLRQRRLRLIRQSRSRPRVRARRSRQGHGGCRERGPPGDDDGGSSPDGPPSRPAALRIPSEARP